MAQESSDAPIRIDDKVQRVLAALRGYSEAVQKLPTDEEYRYHKAFRAFPRAMREQDDRLKALMQRVAECNFSGRRAIDFVSTSATSAGGQRRAHTATMEAVAQLLEQVDRLLDDARGERTKDSDLLATALGGGSLLAGAATNADFSTTFSRRLRPQAEFKNKPDNTSNPFAPWVVDDANGTLVAAGVPGVHPFRELTESHPWLDRQLTAGSEQPPRPLDETPLVTVSTVEELEQMMEHLEVQPEIAVDLEHHSFHSYLGFTCLMQLSSRTHDFIVDSLALRSDLHRLNRVFANPSIVKVFHAAHEDIRWLQKDHGVYVVNLFDTAIALQTMHMPYSLAFLVDHYCQVKLDKTYQTADWRVRPLPQPLVQYARQDTHYLLYCYDRLRAKLADAGTEALQRDGPVSLVSPLLYVLQESRRRSLTLYTKDTFDPEHTWALALGKSLGGLNHAQRTVAQHVFNWRDATARDLDESPPAVLHTSAVLALATRLPVSARDVLRVGHPATVALRRSAADLAKFIAATIGEDLEGDDKEGDVPSIASPTSPASPNEFDTQQQAPLVYRPMTGTLPSCSTRGRATGVAAEVDLPRNAFGDVAVPHSAAPAAAQDKWLRFTAMNGVRRNEAPGTTLRALIHAIPLPGTVNQAAVVVPAGDAAGTKRVSRPLTSPKAGAVTPKTKAHRAEKKKTEETQPLTKEEEPTLAETEQLPQVSTELPKSLREEYGGLGRQTRRRAAGGGAGRGAHKQ